MPACPLDARTVACNCEVNSPGSGRNAFCFAVEQQNVGQAWQRDVNGDGVSEDIVIDQSQVGSCLSFGTSTGDGALFFETFSPADRVRIQELSDQCAGFAKNSTARCWAVNATTSAVVNGCSPPVIETDFETKCANACAQPQLEIVESRVCRSMPHFSCALDCPASFECLVGPNVCCDTSRQATYRFACTAHVPMARVSPFRCAGAEFSNDPPAIDVEVDPAHSMAVIRSLRADGAVDEEVTTPIRGFLGLSTDWCSTAACDIDLAGLVLNLDDFTLRGAGVGKVALARRTSFVGTLRADGQMVFPAGSVIILRATVPALGGALEGDVEVSTAVRGEVLDSGVVRLHLVLESALEGARIELTIEGRIVNRRPRPLIRTADTFECSGTTTRVTLDGSDTIDPDGEADLKLTRWIVDGHLAATNTLVASTSLTVGAHEIELWVQDRAGNTASSRKQVVIVDTSPPQIVGPRNVCLWPPNHKYAVFDAEALGIQVADACDPTPRIELFTVGSSQPDNAAGDGNTQADLIVESTRLCARAERQGTDPNGRVYEFGVRAIDASGNTASARSTLKVEHDNSGGCPAVTANSFADASPCVSTPNQPPSTMSIPAGCTSSPFTLCALALVFLMRRRP